MYDGNQQGRETKKTEDNGDHQDMYANATIKLEVRGTTSMRTIRYKDIIRGHGTMTRQTVTQ